MTKDIMSDTKLDCFFVTWSYSGAITRTYPKARRGFCHSEFK